MAGLATGWSLPTRRTLRRGSAWPGMRVPSGSSARAQGCSMLRTPVTRGLDMARTLAGRRRDAATPGVIDLTWDAPFRGLGGTTFVIPQPYVLANIYNRRTPYSIQYLLNIERELGGDTALEIGYIGSV